MKLFFSGLSASGLLLASLALTGCETTSWDAASPSTPDKQPNAVVARFHVGETVNVNFSGPPDPPPAHEELIKEDGTITLPLIGSIKAAGKTAGELQTEIQTDYVPKYYVRLTVTVKPGDLFYFVQGEVNSHGSRQPYTGDTTVTKAIASAGGLSDYANHTVTLIRADGQVFKVYVDKAIANPRLDLKVYPGDQIKVDRSIF